MGHTLPSLFSSADGVQKMELFFPLKASDADRFVTLLAEFEENGPRIESTSLICNYHQELEQAPTVIVYRFAVGASTSVFQATIVPTLLLNKLRLR